MFYRFIFPIVNWLARFVAHVTVSGTEYMPRAGGLLVVSNHMTNLDALMIGMCFKRELHFMAKIELFNNPILGWIITQLRAFPVNRGEADRAALRHAEGLLHDGRVVAIFPEGRRSKDGGVQQSKGGIALLARRANVPILPVAVTGTGLCAPASCRHGGPGAGRTHHYRGRAVHAAAGTRGRADYNAIANLIMGRVAELLPPAYRGVFAEAMQTISTATTTARNISRQIEQ